MNSMKIKFHSTNFSSALMSMGHFVDSLFQFSGRYDHILHELIELLNKYRDLNPFYSHFVNS